jgi:hypothetical protein
MSQFSFFSSFTVRLMSRATFLSRHFAEHRLSARRRVIAHHVLLQLYERDLTFLPGATGSQRRSPR